MGRVSVVNPARMVRPADGVFYWGQGYCKYTIPVLYSGTSGGYMTTEEKYTYWLELAQYDLESASAMFTTGRWFYVVFICQQAVKYYYHNRQRIVMNS